MTTELISLGILFICAIIGGIIAARFKQPAVFGLLLVGAIIGPNSLNLVQDMNMIRMMADFGAILLLFIIGLDFDVSKLMKLGVRPLLLGLLKFAIVLFFGYETALLLGFSVKVALFVGVILSFSSTVVVVKVLEQKEMFNRKEVPLLIAVLVIEDIIAVIALTFFSGIKNSSTTLISTFEHIIFALSILTLAYFVMLKLLRHVINVIVRNNSDESVLPFLSLGMGALFSYFASYLGLTPSAGAFLAGSLIASLPNSKEYGKAIHPYAMIFTSIFFISMGTLVDFNVVQSNIALIATLLFMVVVSRFIAVGLLTIILANFKNEQPFFSSIAMVSVGEFSLLVAKESEKFGLGIDLVTITAAIIFLSAILMSIGINHSEKIHSKINSKLPLKARLKLERLSNYMRKLFDQMEIENSFTKKLRAESKAAFLLLALEVFAFFALRRAAISIKYEYSHIILYSFYAISAVIMFYITSLIYKRTKAIHHTIAVILTNVESSRNLKKCISVLNSFLLALFLFLSAMLFPFAIFMFNLSPVANMIPFVLLAASFYCLKRFIMLVDGNSSNYTPSYSASLSFSKL